MAAGAGVCGGAGSWAKHVIAESGGHPGLVEETIPGAAPERIALLRLDTDWYASTKHELDHLYERVPSGGVVIIDDYDYWEGSRKAVDEFIASTGARLLLAPMGSGRIAIKP